MTPRKPSSRTAGRAGLSGELLLKLFKTPSIASAALGFRKYKGAHTTLLCNRAVGARSRANPLFYGVGAVLGRHEKLIEASGAARGWGYNKPRSTPYDLGTQRGVRTIGPSQKRATR